MTYIPFWLFQIDVFLNSLKFFRAKFLYLSRASFRPFFLFCSSLLIRIWTRIRNNAAYPAEIQLRNILFLLFSYTSFVLLCYCQHIVVECMVYWIWMGLIWNGQSSIIVSLNPSTYISIYLREGWSIYLEFEFHLDKFWFGFRCINYVGLSSS